MRRHFLSVLCLGLLLAATTVQAGGRGTSVGILFDDTSTNCIRSDGTTGPDGLYEYLDGVEGVIARMDGMGVVTMKPKPITFTEYTRHVYFCLAHQSNDTSGNPAPVYDPPFTTFEPWQTYFSATANVPGGLPGMAVGSTADGIAEFDFHPSYKFEHWCVEFNDATHPNTSYVTITRLDEVTWTITAAPDYVAELMLPNRHMTDHTCVGYYSMPFSMTVRIL